MMHNSIIKKHIRKICSKRLIWPMLFLCIILFVFLYVPFQDIFYPPDAESVADCETFYQDGQQYVSIVLKRIQYTGYDYVKNGKEYGSYYYYLSNNHCNFILIPIDKTSGKSMYLNNYHLKGKMVEGDYLYEQMLQLFSKDLDWTLSGLTSVSSTMVISEIDYHLNEYVMVFSCLFVFFVILLVNNIGLLMFFCFPSLHPACLKLYRYGLVREQVKQIDFELQNRLQMQVSCMYITDHYYVDLGTSHIAIHPLSSIIWAYKHSILHRYPGARNKMTYTLRIWAKKNMKSVTPKKSKEDVDIVIDYFQAHIPDLLIGYSDETKKEAMRRLV